jgi:pyruvate dehydrogenase E2 component (dihydrolipoamide acetyltransferase)
MKVDFRLPELGENIISGDVVNVLVREGDVIAGNQGVIELETDKAVVEIPCPHAGKIVKVHVVKGQSIKVGQAVLSIETEESIKPRPVVAPTPSAEPTHPPSTIRHPPSVLAAGPETRRVARELGVEISSVEGSGKGGRITVEDVKAAASAARSPHPGPLPRGEGTELLGRFSKGEGTDLSGRRQQEEGIELSGESGKDAYGPVRRQRMSKIRRTIAAQMVKSAGTIPHVTNFDDADVTDLDRLRKTIPPASLDPTVKLTAMPFVIKAVALTLRQHPVLNASLDEEKEEIVYKEYVNVGVAIDTPRGLVVPAIRGVDRMGVVDIAHHLAAMAARVRAAEFTVDELRGGTFTISNLGAVGGTYSTPIINHPEVALLLLGRSRWLPIIREENIEKRLMMPLSLSYDHRVVDGAAAGRFLNDVIDYLQSPGKLLLNK